MNQNDTIIALATPVGVGAISVIRISGEKSISLVSSFFISKNKNKKILNEKTHTIHLGYIVQNKNIIDEVLVSIFKNPYSYTGEDVVEISCHGSLFIQQEIINLFIKNGCRIANNGEFTMRAFLNGKMDLTQAEAVADLIASNSVANHQMAINQMRGGITNELQFLREQLLDFASLIELELDFSTEDVEFADKEKFKKLVNKISKVLKNLLDSFAFGNAIKNGIPVAIIGRPNVGKSTLLNTLLNEDKAIVSELAGTTRDTIEDEVIVNGVSFRFIDTAGIRKTKDQIESIGIKKSYEKADKAQLIIFLFDACQELNNNKEILQIIERFKNKRILFIANKIDNLSKTEILKIKNNISINNKLIFISAKEKTGINKLKEELISLVNIGALSNNETIITNSRHFEALTLALKSISSVKKGIELGVSSDLLAIDISECLRQLGNVTGKYDIDKDILGNIFSKFCIGK